jgi:hypothetical protein
MKIINNICDNINLEDLPNEIWKDALFFDGIISVSNLGRVKREKGLDIMNRPIKERILKRSYRKGKNGHFCGAQIAFGFNGIDYVKQVSRLVVEAFVCEIPKNKVVVHLDKKIFNDKLENLKIETLSNSLKLDYKLNKRKDWGIFSAYKNPNV